MSSLAAAMSSFEDEAATNHYQNPLPMDDAANSPRQRTARRHFVMAEFEESDGNIAKAIEAEDLFDAIKESVHEQDGRTWRESAEVELKEMFKDTRDWGAPIEKKDLKRMLEASLQVAISNKLLLDLFRQIDVDGDETVTAHEFRDWFLAQTQASQEEGEAVDPNQVRMQQMQAQSFIIDPNSGFRGNWDIVQAGLLSEMPCPATLRTCTNASHAH